MKQSQIMKGFYFAIFSDSFIARLIHAAYSKKKFRNRTLSITNTGE